MNYKLEEVANKIFAVIVEDRYDRAMLFCKAQEFYESPNPDFQFQYFSIWDYMRWYSKTNKKGFTYPMDWSGFNIPLHIVAQCYNSNNPHRLETPYDQKMIGILEQTLRTASILAKESTTDAETTDAESCLDQNALNQNGYLIGTDSLKSETFSHELCHAKYMTDPTYKTQIQASIELIKSLHPLEFDLLRQNIISMGYAPSVVEDEIQAYLQDKTPENDVLKGISSEKLKKLKSLF